MRYKVEKTKVYSVDEAVVLLTEISAVKFNESIEVAVQLGVDPRKTDKIVRGATIMPYGLGKKVRVVVFAHGAKADAARSAGAQLVGMEDLAAEIQKGKLDFDVVIATPDALRVISQVGKILGPRALMPNQKVGTVTHDVFAAVKDAQTGKVRFRTDKNGLINALVGKVGFPVEAIKGNIKALLIDINQLKPSASKGVYLKKVAISTTMGPGLTIDHESKSL